MISTPFQVKKLCPGRQNHQMFPKTSKLNQNQSKYFLKHLKDSTVASEIPPSVGLHQENYHDGLQFLVLSYVIDHVRGTDTRLARSLSILHARRVSILILKTGLFEALVVLGRVLQPATKLT